jgi:thiamine-monophosphate kinase
VAGPLGRSAAGLALLSAGVAADTASAALAGLVAAHLRPSPPYQAGPEAALLGATAMIDVSDGLVADLGHVAAASGVALDIDSSALVTGGPLAEAAAALEGKTSDSYGTGRGFSAPAIALEWVLTGGEDHSLVAAFPASAVLPSQWRVIGAVRAGAGVTVNGAPHAGPGGWQHFR